MKSGLRFKRVGGATLARILVIFLLTHGAGMAQSPVGKAAGSKAAGSKAKRADTVGEISIVGSTELPNVTFSLPWQLPSVESRDGQKPPREIAGMFAPLDPKWHRQQIHFNRYLDVDLPSYQVK